MIVSACMQAFYCAIALVATTNISEDRNDLFFLSQGKPRWMALHYSSPECIRSLALLLLHVPQKDLIWIRPAEMVIPNIKMRGNKSHPAKQVSWLAPFWLPDMVSISKAWCWYGLECHFPNLSANAFSLLKAPMLRITFCFWSLKQIVEVCGKMLKKLLCSYGVFEWHICIPL